MSLASDLSRPSAPAAGPGRRRVADRRAGHRDPRRRARRVVRVRGAVVAYATELKATLLDVDPVLLDERGAVDPDVARAMAAECGPAGCGRRARDRRRRRTRAAGRRRHRAHPVSTPTGRRSGRSGCPVTGRRPRAERGRGCGSRSFVRRGNLARPEGAAGVRAEHLCSTGPLLRP